MLELLLPRLRRLAVAILSAPIRAYRYVLSPVMPPSCRFHPSCSAYALEALAAHGPFKGSWLALRRLTRCHPITWLGGGSGYDPVPRHGRPR
jgi:putative membrane protein insertion efficiency factor